MIWPVNKSPLAPIELEVRDSGECDLTGFVQFMKTVPRRLGAAQEQRQ